ncbi:Werner Syndrome-like exonuclease isoform X2 [Ricinus communis]|uniref:Werner Syndrome-like exonuclease isoform X2 n=1 Tax=Ricinus communis TaxID=3988 RepID=UPI00201ABFA2|nr:Werner Syndrome-like exonuclease isoform X2 [Ricinus communis]
MHHQQITSSRFPSSISVRDLQPLSNEELEAIDAIEAAFQQSSSSSITNSKRRSSPHKNDDEYLRKTPRRQLPNSVLGLSAPFSLSPCQDNVKVRYPALKFGGRIFYSRTREDVEKAARELLRSIECQRKETVALGFDIEWKPTFKRGVLPGKTAVMQLCTGTDYCHVMHIIHSGIPKSLQSLLEDSALLKVGVGVGNDSVKVFTDYNVSVKAVEDLSYLARKKIGGKPKSWSLQSLTEMLVCKEDLVHCASNSLLSVLSPVNFDYRSPSCKKSNILCLLLGYHVP